MRLLHAAGAAALLLFCLASSNPASAYDITGSWAGKASCKGLASGQKFATKLDVTAVVSQSDRDLNIVFGGLSFLSHASGIAIPDGKKPDKGALGFVSCASRLTPLLGITGRATVTTTTGKTKATVKFLTVVAGKDISELNIGDGAFACTGTLKRTQTTDPMVSACPPT